LPVVPTLDVENYLDFKTMTRYLKAVAQAAPHLVTVASIGKSPGGRPLVVAEVTNGDGREKPGIWIDGGHQGWNLLGSTSCLELLRFLVAGHGRDELLTELVDNTVFYIAPRLAPDEMDQCLQNGALVMQQADKSKAPAEGRQFRIPNSLGSWKPFKRDHRVLVPRNPEDREGPFYDLYRSLDSGRLARVGPNDFPSPRHPYISSQQSSTRAVIEFMRKYKNVFGIISTTGPGDRINLISDSAQSKTLTTLESRLGELAGLAVGQRCPTNHREGQFLAWASRSLGVLAVDCQMWSLRTAAGLKQDDLEDPFMAEETELLQLMRFCEKEFPEGCYGEWTKKIDPVLGEGEIGGWDWSQTWLNPPSGPYLARELKKLTRLALGLAAASPRIHLRMPEEEVLGWSQDKQPLRKLTLTVENAGYMPTCPVESGQPMEGVIELALGSNSLVMGQSPTPLTELGGIGGHLCQDGLPLDDQGDTLPTIRAKSYDFLVQGSAPVEIVVSHPLAGTRRISSKPPQSLTAPSFDDSAFLPTTSTEAKPTEEDPFEDAFPSFEDIYDEPTAPALSAPTQAPPNPPPPLPERGTQEIGPPPIPDSAASGEFNIPDPPDASKKARPVTFGTLGEPSAESQNSGPFPTKKPTKGRVFGSPPQKPTGGLPAALGGKTPNQSRKPEAKGEGDFSPLPLIKSKEGQGGGAFEPMTPGLGKTPEKTEKILGETIGGDVPAPNKKEPPSENPSAPPARLSRMSAPQLLRRQRGNQGPREPFKR
jgi:zinc carboxypeptidase